jgi:hypothetical protein
VRSTIQNEQIDSDPRKIGGWGSVLSSKHPCTPFIKTILKHFFRKKTFFKLKIFFFSPLMSFLAETLHIDPYYVFLWSRHQEQ